MANSSCASTGCKNAAKTLALFVANRDPTEVAVCNEHVHLLGMDYLLPNPARFDDASLGVSFEDCNLHAVVFAYEPQRYTIVLKGNRTGAVFLFETGYVQACSLYGAVKVTPSEIPLTYDLFSRIIGATGSRLIAAVVDAFDRNSHSHRFYLVLETTNGPIKMQCRGSDAVGIAHFARVPVKIDAAFLGKESPR